MRRYNAFNYILVCFKCLKYTALADKAHGPNEQFKVRNHSKAYLNGFLSAHLECGCIQCICESDDRYKNIVDVFNDGNKFSDTLETI